MNFNKVDQEAYEILRQNFESITYSKNVFIPLTNYCRNNCQYCGFNSGERYLLGPEEFKSLIKEARELGTTESLFVFGEKPQEVRGFQKELQEIGYKSFLDYLKDCYRFSLKNDLIPHTNPGVVNKDFIEEIRRYNGSLGLMLENIKELEVHSESPGKKPEKRIEFLKHLGKKKIPTTTGLLLGIGESKKDRIDSLKKIKELDKKYGHIQEIIIQPFRPNKGSDLDNTVSKTDLLKTISITRSLFPKKEIQSPPNLLENPIDLVKAGVSDLGGISQVTKDYVNPETNWPTIEELGKKILKETNFSFEHRLPVYTDFINEEWLSKEVLNVINKTKTSGLVK